ncbi:Pirin [Vanrija pseudolonga]|uniref:Pirin n=1 Tax=Vanrija pseudolonga TaxID=143232 RepID=A0AAF1BKH7_9TREE|nr:Pirin [Vanrija pseudolonga]
MLHRAISAPTLRNLTTKRTLTTTMTTSNVTRSPAKIVYARDTPEGVGATVRRSIGTPALRNLSPFLMLDHATIHPGSGFPDHPHRGQSTVSYVLGGMWQHEDFTGNAGKLEKGDVQWMVAGRGIVHSEMPLFHDDPAKAEPTEALQLWVDLPADKKFIEPSYQEKKAADIDTVTPSDGVSVTVISGESHGVTGFVRPVGGCWFFDYKLSKPGASAFQQIPKGWTAFVYVITGKLQLGEDATPVDKHHTVVLSAEDDEDGVLLTRPEGTTDETRFVLIAGEPLDQPVVQYGPFVVNTQKQVMEALSDYGKGQNGFERAPGWKSKIGSKLQG